MLVAGPPSSGTCVITMADPWQAIAQPGQADHDVIDYPTAVYGSCNRPIVGEVVSVDVAASPSARVAATDYLNEATSCALDAIGYTGAIAPVVDQSAGGPGIVWEPAVAFQTTLVGPNSLQRDAGKHWSACIVGSDNAQPYLGRLHNALTTGVLPPAVRVVLAVGRPERTRAVSVRCAARGRAARLDQPGWDAGQRDRDPAHLHHLRQPCTSQHRPHPAWRNSAGNTRLRSQPGNCPAAKRTTARHVRGLHRDRAERPTVRPNPDRTRQEAVAAGVNDGECISGPSHVAAADSRRVALALRLPCGVGLAGSTRPPCNP